MAMGPRTPQPVKKEPTVEELASFAHSAGVALNEAVHHALQDPYSQLTDEVRKHLQQAQAVWEMHLDHVGLNFKNLDITS